MLETFSGEPYEIVMNVPLLFTFSAMPIFGIIKTKLSA